MSRGHSNRPADTAATEQGWLAQIYGHRRRVATATAALVAVAVGYHVVCGQNGLTAYDQKRRNARVLEQQVESLTEENERLKGHIDRLGDDPGAIEHQARETLHYTRPGEVIVTLPNETPATHIKQEPQ